MNANVANTKVVNSLIVRGMLDCMLDSPLPVQILDRSAGCCRHAWRGDNSQGQTSPTCSRGWRAWPPMGVGRRACSSELRALGLIIHVALIHGGFPPYATRARAVDGPVPEPSAAPPSPLGTVNGEGCRQHTRLQARHWPHLTRGISAANS